MMVACVNCNYRKNDIINGYMKCYWSCPYRQNNLLKWVDKKIC